MAQNPNQNPNQTPNPNRDQAQQGQNREQAQQGGNPKEPKDRHSQQSAEAGRKGGQQQGGPSQGSHGSRDTNSR